MDSGEQSEWSASLRGASPRRRIELLLDPGSIVALPDECVSPWLAALGRPVRPGDGVLLGHGRLAGETVLWAAQDGRFMGGTLGETHCARITALVRSALRHRPAAVLLLLDSGGVRLHEANSAELGAAELARAVLEARADGIPCLALVAGRVGCFGAASVLAAACDAVVAEEHAQLGASGPRVIALAGADTALNADDPDAVRALMGARARLATGEIARAVPDDARAAAAALRDALDDCRALDFASLERRHATLSARLRTAPRTAEHRTPDALAAALGSVFPDGLRLRSSGPIVSGEVVIAGQALELSGVTEAAPLGVAEVANLVGHWLRRLRGPPGPGVVLCDAVQAFAWDNEAQGFSAWLGLLASCITVARRGGHRVIGLLRRRTSGATGIALGMMCDELHALPGAELHALPPIVMDHFAPGDAALDLIRSPDVRSAYALGTVRAIGTAGLATALARSETVDTRRQLGAWRCAHASPLRTAERVALALTRSIEKGPLPSR